MMSNMQIRTTRESDREIQILSIANTNSNTTYYKYHLIQIPLIANTSKYKYMISNMQIGTPGEGDGEQCACPFSCHGPRLHRF